MNENQIILNFGNNEQKESFLAAFSNWLEENGYYPSSINYGTLDSCKNDEITIVGNTKEWKPQINPIKRKMKLPPYNFDEKEIV